MKKEKAFVILILLSSISLHANLSTTLGKKPLRLRDYTGIGYSKNKSINLPTFLRKTGRFIKNHFDYNLYFASSYSYSGVKYGDLDSLLLNELSFSAKEVFELEFFLGYEYNPLMSHMEETFGNPIERGGLLWGARMTIRPSSTLSILLSYGTTEEDVYTLNDKFFDSLRLENSADRRGSSLKVKHKANFILEKKIKNNSSIRFEAKYIQYERNTNRFESFNSSLNFDESGK